MILFPFLIYNYIVIFCQFKFVKLKLVILFLTYKMYETFFNYILQGVFIKIIYKMTTPTFIIITNSVA